MVDTTERDILLHLPHASLEIPAEWLPLFALSPEEIRWEQLVMTDWFTDELFDLPGEAERLVFPVSRLLVDPERFVDDAQEPMAARGMGVVYTRTHDGRVLKSDAAREVLVETYYVPHHRQLAEWVRKRLERFGRCLIVDCHSFPSSPLPCDFDQYPERPDICIGTAGLHSPEILVTAAVRAFEALGYSVEVDRPYAGTIVPLAYFGREPRVSSLMIEVNRALYMDEEDAGRLATFSQRTAHITQVLQQVMAAWHQSP